MLEFMYFKSLFTHNQKYLVTDITRPSLCSQQFDQHMLFMVQLLWADFLDTSITVDLKRHHLCCISVLQESEEEQRLSHNALSQKVERNEKYWVSFSVTQCPVTAGTMLGNCVTMSHSSGAVKITNNAHNTISGWRILKIFHVYL